MHAAAAACTAEIKNRLLNKLQEAGQKTRGSTLISHSGQLTYARTGSPLAPERTFPNPTSFPLAAGDGNSLRGAGKVLFSIIAICTFTIYAAMIPSGTQKVKRRASAHPSSSGNIQSPSRASSPESRRRQSYREAGRPEKSSWQSAPPSCRRS